MDTVKEKIWQLLGTVNDPEIPVLSILDMGIVRNIDITPDAVTITITPTYTGCPAMDMIATQIRLALIEHGYTHVSVKETLSPAWTTDWMSEEGKRKLMEYGIAPPQPSGSKGPVTCPHCHSTHTKMLSEFGSTACKSLYQCSDCLEPFDYFKCH